MSEQLASRLRDLARRAGLAGVPTSVVVAFAVVAAAAVLLGAWKWWPRESAAVETLTTTQDLREESGGEGASHRDARAAKEPRGNSAVSADASATPIFVHVAGAVRHPGVYQLAPGARVADAVRDAGGLEQNAAADAVNLARQVTDGEQVLVPTKDEAKRAGGALASGGQGRSPSAAGVAGGGAATTQSRVNINTADAALLDTLPGVGPSTAAKIVADREANGRFMSADDLGRVSGIGPKKVEQLKAVICVE